MKLIWNNKKPPPKPKDTSNRLSACKWYLPCVYTKWEILGKVQSDGFDAVCTQGRYCIPCGKTELISVTSY